MSNKKNSKNEKVSSRENKDEIIKKKNNRKIMLMISTLFAFVLVCFLVFLFLFTVDAKLKIAKFQYTSLETEYLSVPHYYKQGEESYVAFNLDSNYFFERKRLVYGEYQDTYYLQTFYKLDETETIALIITKSNEDFQFACYLGQKVSYVLPGQDAYPELMEDAPKCEESIERGERLDYFIGEAQEIKDSYKKYKPWFVFEYQLRP